MKEFKNDKNIIVGLDIGTSYVKAIVGVIMKIMKLIFLGLEELSP